MERTCGAPKRRVNRTSPTSAAAVARPLAWTEVWKRKSVLIAGLALAGIGIHVALRFGFRASPAAFNLSLVITLVVGGCPLLYDLGRKLLKADFGSDLLGGISIITSVAMGQYLAGAVIVLMLAGGQALESHALGSASSVLATLARRMPAVAHRKAGTQITDVALSEIDIGDTLAIYPQEICPVDGLVLEGQGVMDESYLTGEPFKISKASGTPVISGAINGDAVLIIQATRRAADSRYNRIMEVMRESQQTRPRLRRLGDKLGAVYTPMAVAVAALAWAVSGESIRFLAVLVVATPCPLLLGIPIAIIGAISLCARRAILVKDPTALELIAECSTAIFDKTGTLTYGEPELTEQRVSPGFEPREVLALAASLEVCSKHPLGRAIVAAAAEQALPLHPARAISEAPGQGLRGIVGERRIEITSRAKLVAASPPGIENLQPPTAGLECMILIDGRFAAEYRLRDALRADGSSFIRHLGPKHQFQRIMIVSGDRESEVRYLAELVGVTEVQAGTSPEEKLETVRAETRRVKTLYVGDGINDAPAMTAATVGMAMGHNSDVASEAAGVVVMESSLRKVDEFMHISRRMRTIALQTAVGGIALSLTAMAFAATGRLAPVAGAITQEIIDVVAVLNALRAAFPPGTISDIEDDTGDSRRRQSGRFKAPRARGRSSTDQH